MRYAGDKAKDYFRTTKIHCQIKASCFVQKYEVVVSKFDVFLHHTVMGVMQEVGIDLNQCKPMFDLCKSSIDNLKGIRPSRNHASNVAIDNSDKKPAY